MRGANVVSGKTKREDAPLSDDMGVVRMKRLERYYILGDNNLPSRKAGAAAALVETRSRSCYVLPNRWKKHFHPTSS